MRCSVYPSSLPGTQILAQAEIPARSGSAGGYARYRSEQTLLYRTVVEAFLELLNTQGRALPDHVQQVFAPYL